MNRLRLVVALAASAALAPMAAAQTVTDPDPLSAPQIGIAGARQPAPMQAPPAAAAPVARPVAPPPAPRASHWNAPSAAPRPAAPVYSARPGVPGPAPAAREVRREVRQPGPPMGTAQAQGRYRQDGQVRTGQVRTGQVRTGEVQTSRMYGGRMHGGASRGGSTHHGGYRQYHRVQRGGYVPRYWWGPQFVVRNWGAYGFPQPYAGSRWVRYYDDALLIDRYGRVHDVRGDWDWNRSGERWSEDDDGVPVYVGNGEFEPEDWDYEWAEGWDRGEHRGQAYAEDCGPTPGGVCGAGYGQAYPGYGYAPCACGPVVVTETTVTTPAVVEQVTYYDYVEERVARPAAKVRSRRVKVQRIPVEPYRGEKG
ncbi:RcnB family protein [Allosphingosinicella deserti]|uniref:RcnB family protein n=1 Tax=Allosphingosinicella deserti TaxID=2116704 RepID=A0A2P7QG04_9SPHN|nr:RcnB family protein [Sphingomonas deserti]PSJ36931.1 hypothetical protein C7I55_24815 [Sphingomonas deserti]